MEGKLFVVEGKSKSVETRGVWEGVRFPVLEFAVANSPQQAVEQVYTAMDKEEDRWLDEANALIDKGQEPTTMRPFKPICKVDWKAREVSVPGYKITIEAATS